MKTFVISEDEQSITCLKCNSTSYNQKDVIYRFCGNCHDFHIEHRCDFCMAPDVELVASYKAKQHFTGKFDFLRKGLEVIDDGDWMACVECSTLIHDKNFEALLDRSVTGTVLMDPPQWTREETLTKTKALYRFVFGEDFEGLKNQVGE